MATKGGRTDYDKTHRALRAWWADQLQRHGKLHCWRQGPTCTHTIQPGDQWDLGHIDTDPTTPRAQQERRPECWPCNRGEPERRRQREAAGIDAAPRPITHW